MFNESLFPLTNKFAISSVAALILKLEKKIKICIFDILGKIHCTLSLISLYVFMGCHVCLILTQRSKIQIKCFVASSMPIEFNRVLPKKYPGNLSYGGDKFGSIQ